MFGEDCTCRHCLHHGAAAALSASAHNFAFRASVNTANATVLSLNLGSSTLKASHYSYRHGVGGASLLPLGDRIEVPIQTENGIRADQASLLEQVASLHPEDLLTPDVVAYRVVHGGSRLAPALLTDDVLAELATYAPLAPLHQPASLALAQLARGRWPNARHVAVFDTTWHSTLPEWSRRLPVPRALHDAGVMRYGFHGLAFQSAMRKLCVLDTVAGSQRVVLAHLGSGCSLCAVNQGRSVDTTMSMTPLDGLPMATRSGALDPGAILFLQRQLKMSTEAVEHLLWRESGLLGLSGQSGDMRHLLAASDDNSELAVEQFVMRVAQGVAAMATSLGGIDALVFTGGIGARAPTIRRRVVDQLAWAGLRIDAERNTAGVDRLDAADSTARIWCLPIDEEYELARASIGILESL